MGDVAQPPSVSTYRLVLALPRLSTLSPSFLAEHQSSVRAWTVFHLDLDILPQNTNF